MLDADPAGRAATMKVVHLFVEAELPCRIAQLRAKDGKKQDPDELARKDLPKLQALIDNAQDAVEFYFEQVASTSAPTVPGRVAAIEEVRAAVALAARSAGARPLLRQAGARCSRSTPALVQRALRAAPAHVSRARGDSGARARPASPPSRSARWRQRHDPAHPPHAPGLPGAARRFLAARGRLLFERRRSADRWLPRRRRAISSTRRGCLNCVLRRDSRRRRQGARRPKNLPGRRRPQRAFESIVTALASAVRSAVRSCSERTVGDRARRPELTEKLNARINAVRRSSR